MAEWETDKTNISNLFLIWKILENAKNVGYERGNWIKTRGDINKCYFIKLPDKVHIISTGSENWGLGVEGLTINVNAIQYEKWKIFLKILFYVPKALGENLFFSRSWIGKIIHPLMVKIHLIKI